MVNVSIIRKIRYTYSVHVRSDALIVFTERIRREACMAVIVVGHKVTHSMKKY